MSEWADISTLITKGHEFHTTGDATVDMYSAGNNIRWPDCGWSEQHMSWFSSIRFIDKDGRRTTQFHLVVDPTHWLVPSPLPRGYEPVSA